MIKCYRGLLDLLENLDEDQLFSATDGLTLDSSGLSPGGLSPSTSLTSSPTNSPPTGNSLNEDEDDDDDDDESDQEEYFAFESWEDYVGYAIGWISAVIYLASRVPQIYRNYQRKTTEGLSRLMFTFAVLGNVTYTISVLVISLNPWYLLGHMPWILGSAGTLVFDATVFYQTFHYRTEVAPPIPFQVEGVQSVSSVEDDTYSIQQIVDVTAPTSSRDYIGLKKSYYYRIGIGVPSAPGPL